VQCAAEVVTYDLGMTSGSRPARSRTVTVRRMTSAEFETWQLHSLRSYAQDIAKATGKPVEAACERARRQFLELLPGGLDTERTWLLTLLDETGAEVGTLWIGPHPERPDIAFVYDIEINERERGRGLGRAAMIVAERLVSDTGVTEIGLNVFGFNDRASRLYDSLGYRVVATQMTKTLTGKNAPPASADSR
jgi:ribosomal protein S18 acetylase RimI-like enzyme